MDVDRFVVEGVGRGPAAAGGAGELRVTGSMEHAVLSVDAGSVFVPADQPLARLAFHLLEPDGEDGLPAGLAPGTLVTGRAYPVYRVR